MVEVAGVLLIVLSKSAKEVGKTMIYLLLEMGLPTHYVVAVTTYAVTDQMVSKRFVRTSTEPSVEPWKAPMFQLYLIVSHLGIHHNMMEVGEALDVRFQEILNHLRTSRVEAPVDAPNLFVAEVVVSMVIAVVLYGEGT